jgi:hypothetical protein
MAHVLSALQQQLDGVVKELLGGVFVFAEELYLLEIFDAPEQYLGRVGRQVCTAKEHVNLQQCVWHRATICHGDLVKDLYDLHWLVPSLQRRAVGDFEGIVYVIIKHVKACLLDVLVREPVVARSFESCVDCCLPGTVKQRLGDIRWVARHIKDMGALRIDDGDSWAIVYGLISWVVRELKRSRGEEGVHGS